MRADPSRRRTALSPSHSTVPVQRIGIDFRLAYHRQAGITRYTHNLLQALPTYAAGYHFTVFHHRKQSAARRYPASWSHRTLFSPVHHAWEQRALQLELRWPGWDLVHFPDVIGPYHTRLPTVITVHDLAWHYWPEILDKQARAYYGQIDKALAHARLILVPTQHTRRDLERLYPTAATKIRVTPYAVDPLFLDPAHTAGMIHAASHSTLALPANYILHVGTLEPRKNIPVLLEAFVAIRQKSRIPDLKLVLAGARGWLQRDLPAWLRQRDLEDHCLLPGQLSEWDLVKTYTQAHCVLHPALYEGFGFTLLESMACGTPVVASSASCLPEIGGNAVLYADARDADGLANQVLSILHDQDLARSLVARGHRQVATFSWARTARQTLDAYRDILAST